MNFLLNIPVSDIPTALAAAYAFIGEGQFTASTSGTSVTISIQLDGSKALTDAEWAIVTKNAYTLTFAAPPVPTPTPTPVPASASFS